MVRESGPPRHARYPLAGDLAIPRLVKEEDTHAGLRESLRDDDVVLAERVELELREEPAGVEADAELISLLGTHALEARHDRVVAGPALLLREEVPPDLALIRELHVELLREPAEIRN